MGKETIDTLIEGGKATAAPPLGPAISQIGMGMLIGKIISEINEKTKAFSGMQVPVKIIIDTEAKKFEITIGTPPISSMLKKALNVQKLATVNEDKTRKMAGSIKMDKIVEIAKNKDMAGDLKNRVKQVLGTCLSCGVLVDEKDPREIIREINENKITI